MAVGVIRRRQFPRGIVKLLTEGWEQVAPAGPIVGRPIDAALVKADAAVVLARQEVGPVGRVEGDPLLGLAAERAVLVHAHVALTYVALTAAERVRAARNRGSNGEISIVAAGHVGRLLPQLVRGNAHDAC